MALPKESGLMLRPQHEARNQEKSTSHVGMNDKTDRASTTLCASWRESCTGPQGMRRSGVTAAALWLLPCASTTSDLAPAPTVERERMAAAEAIEGNARFEVEAGSWPGDASITQEVTPLRVTIANHGRHPLRIRYEDFVLQGHDRLYVALPPFQIGGRASTAGSRPATRVRHQAFFAAPYFGAYDSAVPLYEKGFLADRHYRTFFRSWRYMDALPTREMLSWALPEGVLDPGGSVSGFLYFEHVDEDDNAVRFRARLVSTDRRSEVANASIPFMPMTR